MIAIIQYNLQSNFANIENWEKAFYVFCMVILFMVLITGLFSGFRYVQNNEKHNK
jgi:cell division protein FtsL